MVVMTAILRLTLGTFREFRHLVWLCALLLPLSSQAACLEFASEQALQERKAFWKQRIERMPQEQVLDWVVGLAGPPSLLQQEANSQKNCLVRAAGKAMRQINVRLPVGTVSGYRGYKRQANIWLRKYEFRGRSFTGISEVARQQCPNLLRPTERLWRPAKKAHKQCWQRLSPHQRQREILQVSAGPGLSRHHWFTDFDLFDSSLNARSWKAGGHLAPVRKWLSGNAHNHGFFRSYGDPVGREGRGYQAEDWHWSYYPAASALQDWLEANADAYEQRLRAEWGDSEAYSLLPQVWRDYVFGISHLHSD